MAQGYTGYTIVGRQVSIEDGPNLDAFSRLRVSNPLNVFNNQFTYDLSPLVFEPYTNNAIAYTAYYDTLNRLAGIGSTFPSPGEFMYMQSYEYIPYQPGKSQLVFITFNMFPTIPVLPDSVKVVGLGDDNNGFFFKYNIGGSNRLSFEITSNSGAGSEIVDQPAWNLDRLDGTGPSGINLRLEFTQILVIDFQALYTGRVRFGFDIDGQIIYAHEFLHANIFTYPYVQTANLPIRVGMESVTGNSDSMYFICCSVSSEGGIDEIDKFGYTFVQDGTQTVSTVNTYLMSLRPTLTFAGITNRTKFILQEIDMINTGNKPVEWKLSIGALPTLPVNYLPVNSNYSAIEYDTAGNYGTGTIVIDSGYAAAGLANKGGNNATAIASRYPITLDAAGAQRALGTLTLTAQALGSPGTSVVYFAFKWKEIR